MNQTNRISRDDRFCYDCATNHLFASILFLFLNPGLPWIRMEGWSRILRCERSLSMFNCGNVNAFVSFFLSRNRSLARSERHDRDIEMGSIALVTLS